MAKEGGDGFFLLGDDPGRDCSRDRALHDLQGQQPSCPHDGRAPECVLGRATDLHGPSRSPRSRVHGPQAPGQRQSPDQVLRRRPLGCRGNVSHGEMGLDHHQLS